LAYGERDAINGDRSRKVVAFDRSSQVAHQDVPSGRVIKRCGVWCHSPMVARCVRGVRSGLSLLAAIYLPHTTKRPRWTRDGGNGGV